MCYPSILSPLSTQPFVFYHRANPTNRLNNDTITPLLQRKLRLPVLPPSLHLKQCPLCQKAPIDLEGDHLLSCVGAPKTSLHNSIRDSLFKICKTLLPLAGIVHSAHSVSLETHIEGTSLRPADVGFVPKPSALRKTPPIPINLVAIDVTVTGHPTSDDTPTNPTAVSTPGTTPARPAPTKQTLDSVHQAAATRKLYCHQYTNTHPHTTPQLNTAKQFVQWFLDNNIARVPFTVDPLLGLGPFSHHFLFGKTATAPQPPTDTFLPHPHQPAKLALQLALSIPTNICGKANRIYKATHPTFPITFTPFTPSSWATHYIALNASIALAKHIQTSMAQTLHKFTETPTRKLTTIGPNFHHATSPQTIHPHPRDDWNPY